MLWDIVDELPLVTDDGDAEIDSADVGGHEHAGQYW